MTGSRFLLLSCFRTSPSTVRQQKREAGSIAFKSGQKKRRESMWECEEMGRITITERGEGEEKGGKKKVREVRCRQNVSDRRRQRG